MRHVLGIIVLVASLAFVGGALIWRSTESSRRVPSHVIPPPPPPVNHYDPADTVRTFGEEAKPSKTPPPLRVVAEPEISERSWPMKPLPTFTVEPKWEVAFKDALDDAAAPTRVTKVGASGLVEYFEPKRALLLKTDDEGEVFAALHTPLPGDLRIKFKALRAKYAQQVSIGLFFGIRGSTGTGTMDGYFAEWARGIAQVKRERQVLKCVDAPTPTTEDRWVNLELRRVGGTISMLMENKEVLSFIDPQPLSDAAHDRCTFYVWSDQTLIRDVVIERNANDPLKPIVVTPTAPNAQPAPVEDSADF